MQTQSARIRDWLGSDPYAFSIGDLKRFKSPSSADHEFVEYLVGDAGRQPVVEFSSLRKLREAGRALEPPLVAVHPHEDNDCEVLRAIVHAELAGKLFVVIWHGDDMVRRWLDGLEAINLNQEATPAVAPDVVQIEAAKCWVDEHYNGLGHGNGKSAVVQLLREFTLDGYPLEADTWLHAFFAAGGSFGSAAQIEKLIQERRAGVRHRIKPRYVSDIVGVLRERATSAR